MMRFILLARWSSSRRRWALLFVGDLRRRIRRHLEALRSLQDRMARHEPNFLVAFGGALRRDAGACWIEVLALAGEDGQYPEPA